MREQERFEIEVHVAGITFRQFGETLEVLIAKRSPSRKFYPHLWECGGGQVQPNENFEEATKRQQREELNVDIQVIAPSGVYEIIAPDLAQKKVPGIQFVCKWIAGEPRVNSEEHTECKWITLDCLQEVDFIPGLIDNIKQGAELIKNYSL